MKTWLSEEIKGSKLFDLCSRCLFFNFIYSIAIANALAVLGIELPERTGLIFLKQMTLSNIVFGFFFLALAEEIFFRLPIALAKFLPLSIPTKTILCALPLSLIFGAMHGTLWNIFIQGVCGFTWCLLFVKAGGLNGKWFKALMVTTLTHFSFNMIIVLVLISKY